MQLCLPQLFFPILRWKWVNIFKKLKFYLNLLNNQQLTLPNLRNETSPIYQYPNRNSQMHLSQ